VDLPKLEAVQLRDPDGAVHRLGDLWEMKPVVLVFLRHFG